MRFVKSSLWLHGILTAYAWLVELVPLGKWNYQKKDHMLIGLLKGKGLEWGDLALLIFIEVPLCLFWMGYKKRIFAFYCCNYL
jgi:hypothetical protein